MNQYQFEVNGIVYIILAISLYAAMKQLREDLGLE